MMSSSDSFTNFETANVFFCKTEFIYSFLCCTVNVNSNIEFRKLAVSKYSWNHLMSRADNFQAPVFSRHSLKLSLPKNYKCIKSFQFFSALLEFFLQNVPNRIFFNFGKKVSHFSFEMHIQVSTLCAESGPQTSIGYVSPMLRVTGIPCYIR